MVRGRMRPRVSCADCGPIFHINWYVLSAFASPLATQAGDSYEQ